MAKVGSKTIKIKTYPTAQKFFNFCKKMSEKKIFFDSLKNKCKFLLKILKLNFQEKKKFENRHVKKVNLTGGGKKRKKKNYTKPKKIKRIQKSIRLNLLNYYSIENGKIKKLKKESPQSPGCFMAQHFDRLTCGKTGLTLVRFG